MERKKERSGRREGKKKGGEGPLFSDVAAGVRRLSPQALAGRREREKKKENPPSSSQRYFGKKEITPNFSFACVVMAEETQTYGRRLPTGGERCVYLVFSSSVCEQRNAALTRRTTNGEEKVGLRGDGRVLCEGVPRE